MTVNSQQNKISYMGNGAAKDFTVPFPYLDKSHLTVRQMLNGVQSERTDWTVSGGTLTFETAPANNAQIVIMRQVPLTQETDYRENEILSAETLERCFDKLTMQVQQLEEKSGRAVTVDVFDDTNAASLIPSIRKAVSDCTAAAASARANADTASEKAVQAQTSATNAASAETHTAAMLSTKASVGLDNLTAAGKESISHLSMPSDSFVELTLGASGTVYTAHSDGYVVFNGYATAPQGVVSLLYHPTGLNTLCTAGNNGNPYLRVYLPVSKGAQFRAEYYSINTDGNGFMFRFYYAKGVC